MGTAMIVPQPSYSEHKHFVFQSSSTRSLFSWILKPDYYIYCSYFQPQELSASIFLEQPFLGKLFPKVLSVILGSLRVNENMPKLACRVLQLEFLSC